MIVGDFCEKHKVDDLFERMKKAWNCYRDRDLGVDCA